MSNRKNIRNFNEKIRGNRRRSMPAVWEEAEVIAIIKVSKQILLTQGQFALVDAKNYDWLNQWKWYAWWNESTKSFYAVRSVNNKQHLIYMHREILGLKRGDKRKSDHIDHNTLDNRESKLRIVTNQQNNFNQRNTKGYSWDKIAGKYRARILLNGKMIHLGYFDTTDEAHNAYLKAKEKHHKI